jgi:KTSC domain
MKMTLTPSSSSIKAYGWGLKAVKNNAAMPTLSVVFHTGKEYNYYDVPLKVYERLQKADSIGKFINSEVKNKFKHEYIGEYDA